MFHEEESDICGFKQPPPHGSSLDSILTTVIHGYITFNFETMMLIFLFIIRNMLTCHMCYRKSNLDLRPTCSVDSSDDSFTSY